MSEEKKKVSEIIRDNAKKRDISKLCGEGGKNNR